jgi:putative transposase
LKVEKGVGGSILPAGRDSHCLAGLREKGGAAMKGSYQVAGVKDRSRIAEFLSKECQVLLPLVDLVEEARLAVDDLVEVVGRAAIEAVLVLSAQGVAGSKQRGKARGEIRWHGRQAGRVCMSERKVRVVRPRLRRKGKGQ